MRAALITILCLTASSVWADEKVGSSGEFLGWHPKSTNFAYILTTRSHVEPTRITTFMKHMDTKGTRARRMKYGGSVRERIAKQGFIVPPALRGQRVSPYVQTFALPGGKRLRITLDVRSEKLGYTVWLDASSARGDSKRLIGGKFDELWTDLNVEVYPSPNGHWMALVLRMETNFRTLTWVEGVLVRSRR